MTTANPSPTPPATTPISPGGPVTGTETPLDLDAVDARLARRFGSPQWARDVDALIAEVRRLRARVENHHCGGRAAASE
jgi:hypothetical protein